MKIFLIQKKIVCNVNIHIKNLYIMTSAISENLLKIMMSAKNAQDFIRY
jgi:hypothetical protein